MIKQVINLSDGTACHTRNVFIGDSIKSMQIKGMPSSGTNDQENFKDWSTKSVNGDIRNTWVVQKVPVLRKGYWQINTMHFVSDQPILVKRNSYWEWKYPNQIQKDDLLVQKDSELKVTSTEFIQTKVQSFELKTDLFDTFFLNGVLVHNRV